MHLIEIPLGEQRPNRAIRDAAGEDFFLGGTALALEEAAGETPSCGSLLAIIDREREKVQARTGLGVAAGSDENDGFPELNGNSTVRLFRNFAGFNMNLSTADVGGYFM